MIRVGLAGAGPWAGMFTVPMLTSTPELSLTAIWARRRPAAEALARQHDAIAVNSYDELLAACDAVAFCVPADVQARLAIDAARAGKHLLLEKPVAFSVPDAEAVASAADTAGVATQLMLTFRFTGPVRTFLATLADTKIDYVRTTFIGGGGLDGSPFATPWRQQDGAALLDIGPHALDLAEAAAGPVTEVRAERSGAVVTVATVHDSGARGHVAISLTTPGPPTPPEAEAITDTGRVLLADPMSYPQRELHRTIGEEFARTVRGEATQTLDVHHGVRLQHLLAAVATSLHTGHAVRP